MLTDDESDHGPRLDGTWGGADGDDGGLGILLTDMLARYWELDKEDLIQAYEALVNAGVAEVPPPGLKPGQRPKWVIRRFWKKEILPLISARQ